MKISKQVEEKINGIIASMTIEEKVAFCHANSKFTSSGLKRLGIEDLTMSDGPHGVRPEFEKDSWTMLNRPEDNCTYLPTGTALAATWNPELARLFGETLGSEARYRNKDVILGPGINIIRTPLCGRNFEYMSEDPCLIEKTVPELVKGIQSQDTAACVKHFALNNQESDRGFVNVEVSDRALNEIYLKGFKAAVTEGNALSVMGAYNRYKNQHCCHNDYLLNKILKEKWGFKGAVISDWDGTHDTEQAIFNGLDIEMGTDKPYDEFYLADAFIKRAKESKEVENILDDKVHRILYLMFSINKMEENRKKGEFNTKEHQQAAYKIASEAMVLLKNENNLLPIKKENLKKILVMGHNAVLEHSEGGCSSGIRAKYEITPLEGIKNRFGDFCEIEYERGNLEVSYHSIPLQNMTIADLSAGCRGFKIVSHSKDCISECISNTACHNDGRCEKYEFSVGIEIPKDGTYSFLFKTTGSVSGTVNGSDNLSLRYEPWNEFTATDLSFDCKKGQIIDIYAKALKGDERALNFSIEWLTPDDYASVSSESKLLQKAAKADYVIYCGGLDHGYDTEACDKSSMKLPAEQDVIIPKLLKVNKNTVIALTAGSPFSMPWIENANAVIWNWYAGMEGGNVLADILLGNICPSGKMPFTLPVKYSDTPVARYGEYKTVNCKYNDDIFVGYRGYEKDNIKPLFPFGHGLSYSRFEYSDLRICVEEENVTACFTVKNTGGYTAKEIAQLYIGDPVCSVPRPVKELRNYKKVELAPGQSTRISLPITKSDLCFFDETSGDFKLESGEFTVFIGSSSSDIRLTGNFIF